MLPPSLSSSVFSQKVCRFHISTCFPFVSTFPILPASCLGSQSTSCLSVCISVPPGVVLPAGASGEEPTCQCRRHKRCGFDPWVRKISWRRAWLPIPALLPGESHRQELGRRQSVAHTEVGVTERLSMHIQPPTQPSCSAPAASSPPLVCSQGRVLGPVPSSLFVFHLLLPILLHLLGFPGSSNGKESACNAQDLGLSPGAGKIPWRRKMAAHSSTLAWRVPMD